MQSFDKYEGSLNFIVGMADNGPDWDILNNPYIEYRGYELSDGLTANPDVLTLKNKYELHICPDEEVARFLDEEKFSWYP